MAEVQARQVRLVQLGQRVQASAQPARLGLRDQQVPLALPGRLAQLALLVRLALQVLLGRPEALELLGRLVLLDRLAPPERPAQRVPQAP